MLPCLLVGLLHLEKEFSLPILWFLRHGWVVLDANLFFQTYAVPMDAAFVQPEVLKPLQ